MDRSALVALRKAAFSKAERFEGELWHGCLWDSMASRIQSGFERYFHSTLGFDAFCLSANQQRAIDGFGRNRRGLGNGFHFDFADRPLRITHLKGDWHGLMAAYCEDHRSMANARTWQAAARHGIKLSDDGLALHGRTFDAHSLLKEMIPPTADAFTLPSWREFEELSGYNSEAELVLAKDPQTLLPDALRGVFINGEYFGRQEGLAILQNALVIEDPDWTGYTPPAQLSFPEVLEAVA